MLRFPERWFQTFLSLRCSLNIHNEWTVKRSWSQCFMFMMAFQKNMWGFILYLSIKIDRMVLQKLKLNSLEPQFLFLYKHTYMYIYIYSFQPLFIIIPKILCLKSLFLSLVTQTERTSTDKSEQNLKKIKIIIPALVSKWDEKINHS